mgnify:CR=1 FL=1
MINKFFKIHFITLILFTIFLLIEGFLTYYSSKLSFYFDSFDIGVGGGYNAKIWNENGLIENIQVLLLIFSLINIIITIYHNKNYNNDFILKYFLILYLLSVLYFLGEEISWGQHILEWDSNEFFLTYNSQKETNIHNISNLFNEIPKTFLTLWCGLSFLLFKYLSFFNMNKIIYKKIIFPSKELKYISIMLLIFYIPEFSVDKLGFHQENTHHPRDIVYSKQILPSQIIDFFSFNFIKLSEYHELLFAYYIYNHSYFLKKCI